MRPTPRDDAYRRATRVYRWMVRLYPAAYRRLFGEQMLQTFRDHYRDAVASGDESAGLFWLGVFADESKAIPRARLAALQETWRRWSHAASAAQGREEPIMMSVFRPRLRRYSLLYLLLLLLIPIAATLYGQRKVTEYASVATIYVQNNSFLKDFQSQDDNPYATKAQNVSDSMAQLLQSESFLVSVAKDTSLKTLYPLDSPAGQNAVAARIGGNISVSPNNTRNIVFVTAADRSSAQVAMELNNAVIKEFVAFYADKELDTLKAAKDFYDQQVKDINDKVTSETKAVNDYVKQHPEVLTLVGLNDPKYVQLKSQLDADQATQNSILANVQAVEQAMAAANSGTSYDVKPLDAATLPKSPTVNVSKLLVYPLGALVGVLAALAIIAGIQTKLDRRVYNRRDIEGILDRMEWDPTSVEVMPIISMDGGSGSIKWEDRENSPVPALMMPVLSSLPRPARKQLRSGATHGPRRESRPAPASSETTIDVEV